MRPPRVTATDGLLQERDVRGKPLPQADVSMRVAFAKYMEKIGVACFTAPGEFEMGIKQFKEQFELATGAKPTEETSSLLPPYLAD